MLPAQPTCKAAPTNHNTQLTFACCSPPHRNDAHHSAVFTGESLNLWLAHWCDLYGAILVLAVSCFAVGMAEELGAATVGLAFSNTIQMLVFYTWSVRFLAESLFAMASVEKIGWIAGDVKTEGNATAGPHDPDHDDHHAVDAKASLQIVVGKDKSGKVVLDADGAPVNWPSRGTVVFQNVWMRYSPTAPFALKGVTFSLGHADKVGVVGRTGSGKSTSLLALYRVFELVSVVGLAVVLCSDDGHSCYNRLRAGNSFKPCLALCKLGYLSLHSQRISPNYCACLACDSICGAVCMKCAFRHALKYLC